MYYCGTTTPLWYFRSTNRGQVGKQALELDQYNQRVDALSCNKKVVQVNLECTPWSGSWTEQRQRTWANMCWHMIVQIYDLFLSTGVTVIDDAPVLLTDQDKLWKSHCGHTDHGSCHWHYWRVLQAHCPSDLIFCITWTGHCGPEDRLMVYCWEHIN